MSILSIINKKPKLKRLIHWLLIPSGKARPRIWVKLLLNPFIHKKGNHTNISWRARMDVLPFNKFEIGSNSTIEDFCTINNGVGNVFIGNHTLIGMGNTIIGPIEIGNNVIFAQNIVASGLNHAYQNPDIPIHLQPILKNQIIIEDDCWIGANSVITAGTKIGRHSVVGAGSIITKDIPPYSVVVGNPAKVIKQYNPESGLWEKTN